MSVEAVLANEQPFHVEVGDVLASLHKLPAGCVQSVVTSPPYWNLRSYLPKDHADKAHEIGSEPTPEAFVAKMVEVFAEVRRVLRDDGTLWVNLGDTYDSGTSAGRKPSANVQHGYWQAGGSMGDRRVTSADTKTGDQMLMPHRVALALQADGWLLRSTIIWAKKCLSGGAILYAKTQKGEMPVMVKDLVRLRPETVQLWNGEKWTQVVNWGRTEGEGSHLELELRSGERIGCTGSHRWPTTEGEKTADELQIGDTLLTRRIPEPVIKESIDLVPDEIGWLVGFYIAEGFCTPKNVTFSINANETEYFERIKAIAIRYGASASFRRNRGNAAVVCVHGKVFKAVLLQYATGTTCYNKRLANTAWMRGNSFLSGVMQGYLDGDGHERPSDHRVGFCNNDGLASDLRTLGARLGLSVRLKRTVHSCGDKQFSGWRGSVSSQKRREEDSQIVAIRASRARQFYDIEVADSPNWFCLASGVVTHNSPMPESLSGFRWRRCRVKVAANYDENNPHPNDRDGIVHSRAAHGFGTAQWQLCPGCHKCLPNNGYVLRRGSWRPTTAHEYIFMFAKSGEYFCDGDAVAEPAKQPSGVPTMTAQYKRGFLQSLSSSTLGTNQGSETRNPRSVWSLSSEPEKAKHFATFPSALPRKCLTAATSKAGCCPACGACYAPMVESERVATRSGEDTKSTGDRDAEGNRDPQRHVAVTRVTGYRPTCSCQAGEPVPCLVLDPFSGSGTTGRVAYSMGLRYIGLELSEEYAAISREKIVRPFPVKAATKVKRPSEGQRTLF